MTATSPGRPRRLPVRPVGQVVPSPGSAPSRPIWVPVPVLVRLRPSFAFAAAAGLLTTVLYLLTRRLGDTAPPLVILALLMLIALDMALAVLGFVLFTTALEAGPGDDMSVYGSGQVVRGGWDGRRREHGRFTLEDGTEADVGVTRPRRRDEAPSVVLRLDGRTHRVRCGPDAQAPTWYALLDGSDHETARAEAASGGSRRGLLTPRKPVDWTVHPSRGPGLRLRHDHFATPERVTLLDPTGTAWSVRDRARAELPDELDRLDALFVVVLVDLLGRGAGARESARQNRYS